MACADSATMGIWRVSLAAFRRRVASQPSRTGRLRSMRMSAGSSHRAASIPCAPSPAITTS